MIAPATELGRPEIWATINQNTDTGVNIDRADEDRREALYRVLEHYTLLVAMTAKPTKFAEIIKFCEKLAASPSTEYTHAAPHLPELASPNVKDVAAAKAVQIFSQEEHIDQANPAVQELSKRLQNFFSLNRFISA